AGARAARRAGLGGAPRGALGRPRRPRPRGGGGRVLLPPERGRRERGAAPGVHAVAAGRGAGGSPSGPVAWGPMSSSTRRDLAIVLVVCALAFGWRLGRLGLIDPDEPFYAQTAVEMLARHDLVTPRIFDHPQFEKPALFYWLACASFAAFGRTEAAARLPGATAAALLVLLTWGFGRRIFGARAGRLAALVLASGATFTVSARIMLTDMVFALFLCASCFAFWRAVEAQGARARAGRWTGLAAVASALAVLPKGPLGTRVPGPPGLAWR